MKRIVIVLALILAVSLRAQAPQPVPLAQGGQPGEPHHHLKIENEYVRAYYVEVPPHESTQLHQHDHDYLFVTLGDSDVMNAVLNKPEVRLVLKDGDVHFTRGGFAHVARNMADTPFRNVTIELLKPQQEARNVCGPVISNVGFPICDPAKPERNGNLPLFESSEVTLNLVALGSKEKHSESAIKLAFLVVGLGPDVKMHAKGNSPKTLREGEIAWFDPGSDVQFSNESAKTVEFLELIFKDSAALAKP